MCHRSQQQCKHSVCHRSQRLCRHKVNALSITMFTPRPHSRHCVSESVTVLKLCPHSQRLCRHRDCIVNNTHRGHANFKNILAKSNNFSNHFSLFIRGPCRVFFNQLKEIKNTVFYSFGKRKKLKFRKIQGLQK